MDPLDRLHDQVRRVILARQHPITGLLPASTAVNAHGDYTDAWVRDVIYGLMAPWGLALAYRRRDEAAHRRFELEHAVVRGFRGLLGAMMRQADKVEAFKRTQDPRDALHAKYGTASGLPVVGDAAWGHLQIDATSLFLLQLAQVTASGLPIVQSEVEVRFVQNLVHYVGRAYRTPDYGIWERGDKTNHGRPEVNASSVALAKAALEALDGFDLYGAQGSQRSVVHVVPDDVARARVVLEAMLPRESASKEVDGALLSAIGFPAFAVDDADLVARTRADVQRKLGGRWGYRRFLRDGHQTPAEDPSRLHYEHEELARFAGIEAQWPLFDAYLALDATFRGDARGGRPPPRAPRRAGRGPRRHAAPARGLPGPRRRGGPGAGGPRHPAAGPERQRPAGVGAEPLGARRAPRRGPRGAGRPRPPRAARGRPAAPSPRRAGGAPGRGRRRPGGLRGPGRRLADARPGGAGPGPPRRGAHGRAGRGRGVARARVDGSPRASPGRPRHGPCVPAARRALRLLAHLRRRALVAPLARARGVGEAHPGGARVPAPPRPRRRSADADRCSSPTSTSGPGVEALCDLALELARGAVDGVPVRLGALATLLPGSTQRAHRRPGRLARRHRRAPSDGAGPAAPERRPRAARSRWTPRWRSSSRATPRSPRGSRPPETSRTRWPSLGELARRSGLDAAVPLAGGATASVRALLEEVDVVGGERRAWGVVRTVAGLLERLDPAFVDALDELLVAQKAVVLGKAWREDATRGAAAAGRGARRALARLRPRRRPRPRADAGGRGRARGPGARRSRALPRRADAPGRGAARADGEPPRRRARGHPGRGLRPARSHLASRAGRAAGRGPHERRRPSDAAAAARATGARLGRGARAADRRAHAPRSRRTVGGTGVSARGRSRACRQASSPACGSCSGMPGGS